MSPAAVIFDLDGVLIESEALWDRVRRRFVEERGGRWSAEAQQAMMGMSSPEWSRYMHDQLGVALSPEEICRAVVERVAACYREHVPLLPGAREAVQALSARWPLGLASSSNRPLIDLVLECSGMRERFAVTVSSEEVERGKPAPDVYLQAARLLGASPQRCVAIEDSSNGLLSAHAAGLRVIAIPNREFPPSQRALACATVRLDSIEQLTPELVGSLDG